MREAAGMDLPFQRKDVWFCLAAGIAGEFCAAAYALGARGDYLLLSMAPIVAALAAYVLWCARHARARGEPVVRRREYRGVVVGSVAGIVGIVGLQTMFRVAGLPMFGLYAAVLVSAGVGISLVPLYDPRRSVYIAMGLPLIIVGIAVLYCPDRWLFPLIVGGASSTMLMGSAAMAIHLRLHADIGKSTQ